MATDPSHLGRDVAVAVAAAGLGYFRWTQLVPMLMAWSFLLFMLGSMILVNFQEESFSLLERAGAVYVELVGGDDGAPGPSSDAAQPQQDGSADGAIRFDGEDLKGWIWRAWGVASLAGWLLGGVWRWAFGPGEPWPLGRKLGLAALLAGACSAGLFLVWGFARVTYHGSAVGWTALFLGVPVGVWLLSAWSLGVSHLLGRVVDHLRSGDARPGPSSLRGGPATPG